MARPELIGARALREGDELVEPERAVAPHARIRRRSRLVLLGERIDDHLLEHVAQVEGHVRPPQCVARRASGSHCSRRAARALRVRRGRVLPETERDADGIGPGAVQRHGAVDSSAHRNGDTAGLRRGREHLAERRRERLDRERLAADGGCLQERQPEERTIETGCVSGHDPLAVDGE